VLRLQIEVDDVDGFLLLNERGDELGPAEKRWYKLFYRLEGGSPKLAAKQTGRNGQSRRKHVEPGWPRLGPTGEFRH
jgi:hypothetical protein